MSIKKMIRIFRIRAGRLLFVVVVGWERGTSMERATG